MKLFRHKKGPKRPFVRQYDQTDCGPAALLMVLRYHGGKTSLMNIRSMCQTDHRGTSLQNLIDAASRLGFRTRAARVEYRDLLKAKQPCIVPITWPDNSQHFFVLYRVENNTVSIGDPGRGRYKMSRVKFLTIWRKKAVLFLHPEKNLVKQSVYYWIPWLLTYLKRHRAWIVQSIFLGILYSLAGFFTSIFIQKLIDRYIPDHEIRKILLISSLLLLLLLIRTLVGYIRHRLSLSLNKRISVDITGEVITRLFGLPRTFYNRFKAGVLSARIDDSMAIHRAIHLIIHSTIIDGLILAGSLMLMIHFSPYLTALTLIALPPLGYLYLFSSKRIKYEQNEVMDKHALVKSTFIESVQGIDEISSSGGIHFFSRLNISVFRVFQSSLEKLGITKGTLSALAEITGAFLTVFILVAGAHQVIRNFLSLGELIAFYTLLGHVVSAMINLTASFASMHGADIAAQRLFDILMVPPEKDAGSNPFELKEEIVVSHAVFSYPGADPLFTDLDLTIRAKGMTAIFGPSGIGKTTLANIIERKYELQKGQIRIDDIPADRIALKAYRRNIGVVPQRIKIFNGSIADNILLGRCISHPDELIKRLVELEIAEPFTRFDQGLSTVLGKTGVQLSGGEQQLIALARALYDRPAVVIIDEGMYAMDLDLQENTLRILKKYARSKAVILITHNLDMILRADHVYIMDRHGVIEHGEPFTLLENSSSRLTALYFKQNPLMPMLMNQRSFSAAS